MRVFCALLLPGLLSACTGVKDGGTFLTGERAAAAKPAAEVRAESCASACDAGSKFCLTPTLNRRDPFTSAISSFNDDLLARPASVPFEPLTGTLVPPAAVCSRGDALLDSTGAFESVGAGCTLYFPALPAAADALNGFGLQLPPAISGRISWSGASATSYTIDPIQETEARFPRIYLDRPSGTEWDDVKRITGVRGRLLIETEKTYCVSIKLPVR